jgi:hypothetical protein
MNSKATHELLRSTAKRLHWRHWGAGILTSGIYYFEIETVNQYDEWQFEDEAALLRFVGELQAIC